MSMKLEIDSWDYKEAISAVDKLLANIKCSCIACSDGGDNLKDMPSATEIVDIVIDKII